MVDFKLTGLVSLAATSCGKSRESREALVEVEIAS